MTETTDIADPLVMHTPRWLNLIVATLADIVLLVVTVGIITAMWLPAYLSSRQAVNAVDHSRDDMFGIFPPHR
jgi:hypothetical protein